MERPKLRLVKPEVGIDHNQDAAQRQANAQKPLGRNALRTVRRAGIGVCMLLVAVGGAKKLGVNFQGQPEAPATTYQLPGPADPTAPKIDCMPPNSERSVILGVGDIPGTLSELVHSPSIIPGANLNEAEAIDYISSMNPGVDLRHTAGRAINIPASCSALDP